MCIFIVLVEKPSRADIGFIMDTSAEINVEDFGPLKELVSKLAQRYNISFDNNRVGALLFSNEKWRTIPLDQHLNSTLFGKYLKDITLMNSVTSIDEQLKLAYKNLFSPEGSSRMGVPKVIVLITHENSLNSLDKSALEEAMRPIKESGIRILIAAVGNGNNIPISNTIIGTKDDLFMVPDFQNALEENFLSAFANASVTTIGMLFVTI